MLCCFGFCTCGFEVFCAGGAVYDGGLARAGLVCPPVLGTTKLLPFPELNGAGVGLGLKVFCCFGLCTCGFEVF